MAAVNLGAIESETDVANGPLDETKCCPSGFTNCFAADFHCLGDVNVWQLCF